MGNLASGLAEGEPAGGFRHRRPAAWRGTGQQRRREGSVNVDLTFDVMLTFWPEPPGPNGPAFGGITLVLLIGVPGVRARRSDSRLATAGSVSSGRASGARHLRAQIAAERAKRRRKLSERSRPEHRAPIHSVRVQAIAGPHRDPPATAWAYPACVPQRRRGMSFVVPAHRPRRGPFPR